jgi:hypothetical protein
MSNPGLKLDSRIGNDVSLQTDSKINMLEPPHFPVPCFQHSPAFTYNHATYKLQAAFLISKCTASDI